MEYVWFLATELTDFDERFLKTNLCQPPTPTFPVPGGFGMPAFLRPTYAKLLGVTDNTTGSDLHINSPSFVFWGDWRAPPISCTR